MRASELIRMLKGQIEKHGDLDVVLRIESAGDKWKETVECVSHSEKAVPYIHSDGLMKAEKCLILEE
jgi:hypothetical protein